MYSVEWIPDPRNGKWETIPGCSSMGIVEAKQVAHWYEKEGYSTRINLLAPRVRSTK